MPKALFYRREGLLKTEPAVAKPSAGSERASLARGRAAFEKAKPSMLAEEAFAVAEEAQNAREKAKKLKDNPVNPLSRAEAKNAERARLAEERAAQEQRAEAERVAALEAERTRVEQQKRQELQRRDNERVEALRSGLLVADNERDETIFNEKFPLENRRNLAEQRSAQAMENYLKLKTGLDAKGPSKPPTGGEAASVDQIIAHKKLVQASQELDAALLREVFAETVDPKGAFEAYQKVKKLEADLRSNEKTKEVKAKLDQLKKQKGQEYITDDVINALPASDREIARDLHTVESSNRLTDSHIDRLRTWHTAKSELDLAREEAITQCKTCKIPEKVIKEMTDPNISLEQRRININRATSDGPVRELDKPHTAGEYLSAAWLGVKKAFGRLSGVKIEQQFINPELDERMRKVHALQEKFDAVADTKGAFVGRRPDYVSRNNEALSSNPFTFSDTRRESIIGNLNWENSQDPDPYRQEEMKGMPEQAEGIIATLKKKAEKTTAQDIESARATLQALQKKQRTLGGTFAKDSGEYYQLTKALAEAEGVISDSAQGVEARQQKAEAAQQRVEDERRRSKELGELNTLLQDASQLARFLEESAETANQRQITESEKAIEELVSNLKRYGKYSASALYETTQASITAAQSALDEAKFYLFERSPKAKKKTKDSSQSMAA